MCSVVFGRGSAKGAMGIDGYIAKLKLFATVRLVNVRTSECE
jgi:hypothetical protein